MENICRSPIAEGVLKKALVQYGLSDVIRVESAGTHVSQPGSKPDVRGVRVAGQCGVDITKVRARRVREQDFFELDFILAVDNDNLTALEEVRPRGAETKLMLFMSYALDQSVSEIPDPYYGNDEGFYNVLDSIELGAVGFVEHLLEHLDKH
jgi:protein-tyrosine phosphatase